MKIILLLLSSYFLVFYARAEYVLVGGENKDLSIRCDPGTGRCVGCRADEQVGSIFEDGQRRKGTNRHQIVLSQDPSYCLYRRDMSLAIGPCSSNPPDYHLFSFGDSSLFGYAGDQAWPLWWENFGQELTFVGGRPYLHGAWQLKWRKQARKAKFDPPKNHQIELMGRFYYRAIWYVSPPLIKCSLPVVG
jgi:hypothetical protein